MAHRFQAGRTLHQRLRCFGYFGFGGGFDMANRRFTGNQEWPMYCDRCPENKRCWERHLSRVRELFPAACADLDKYLERYVSGDRAVQEFIKDYGDMEPYLTVMSGNLEDGIAVSYGGTPKDRGPATLSWPLDALREQ